MISYSPFSLHSIHFSAVIAPLCPDGLQKKMKIGISTTIKKKQLLTCSFQLRYNFASSVVSCPLKKLKKTEATYCGSTFSTKPPLSSNFSAFVLIGWLSISTIRQFRSYFSKVILQCLKKSVKKLLI